jgi:hypothetical protein
VLDRRLHNRRHVVILGHHCVRFRHDKRAATFARRQADVDTFSNGNVRDNLPAAVEIHTRLCPPAAGLDRQTAVACVHRRRVYDGDVVPGVAAMPRKPAGTRGVHRQ